MKRTKIGHPVSANNESRGNYLLGGGQRDAGMDGSGRPTSQLAVLPGMTHYNILSFPHLDALITRFLDTPVPKDV